MGNASHPIWSLIRYAMTLGAAAFAMWLFATKFDETEGKALAVFATAIGAGELIKAWMAKQKEANNGAR